MAKKSSKDKLFADVVEAALDFQRRKLWRRIDSDDPISVRIEGEEHPLVVSVLGSAGNQLGVSMIRGENARQYFERLIGSRTSELPPSGCELLSMTFDPRSAVPPELLRLIEASGRVFGKHSSVPVCVMMEPNGKRAPMSRPQLRMLLAVLRTLLGASSAGQLEVRRWDWRRRVLELETLGKGKKATVVGSVITWPGGEAIARAEVRTPVLDERWYSETSAAARTDQVWGVALLPSPGVRDDSTTRDVVLALDEASGAALKPQVIESGDPNALAEAFLELFKSGLPGDAKSAGLPKCVRFLQEPPALQLGSALDELGVKFEIDPDQESLAAAAVHLEQSLHSVEPRDSSEGGPDSILAWKSADARVTEILFKAGRITKAALLSERALERYFGDARDGYELLMSEEDPSLEPVYVGWLLTRFRVRDGAPTVAERVRDQRRLGLLEQSLLEARINAKTVVGQVLSSDPGASFELENSANGDVYTVHDIAMSKSVAPGIGLILDLFNVKEWTFCSLAGPTIAPFAIAEMMGRIEMLGGTFEDGIIVGDHDGLGELFLLPPPMPEIMNSDGEPLELLSLSFRIEPGTDVAAVLASVPGVERSGVDNLWSLTADSSEGSDVSIFGNGVLSTQFEVVGDELLAHVNSEARASEVRALLSAKEGLRFSQMSPTPLPENSVEESGLQEVPAEIQHQIEAMLHKHMIAWLDESIPALGGKTPREAAKDPALRTEVERMIRTYPAAASPGGSIAPPKEAMLRELGLIPGS